MPFCYRSKFTADNTILTEIAFLEERLVNYQVIAVNVRINHGLKIFTVSRNFAADKLR